MNNQLSVFDILYEKYNSKKKIRLIELFGGYGSQHFSLEYLDLDIEHYKLCEWAVKSIQAYKDGHYYNDESDYSKKFDKQYLIDYLFNKGISMDYDKPMTYEQIKKQKEAWLRNVYNNIISTKNLVNIQQVKGNDLEIINTDKYDYIMTYSFPCQDLSLAGLGKGMSRDSGTRSGMLWEVERILDELKNNNMEMPQILLMENVPQVKETANVDNFNEWQLKLEQLGYKNYHQNLIATNYGIPQTRNRTFMISILGDYSYSFPQSIPLKHKLKDLLGNEVDEKYYLSNKMLNCFMSESKDSKFPRKERFLQQLNTTNNKNVAGVVTTCAGNRATDNFIITKDTENYIEWQEKGKLDIDCRAFKEDKVMSTIMTTPKNKVLIKEATKKGYAEAFEGDSINLEQPNSKTRRGRVGKGVSQTLLTSPQIAVVEENLKLKLCNELIQKGIVQENDVIRHNYTTSKNGDCIQSNNETPTLDTRCDCLGVTTKQDNNLRIRKLTPKECFRLMGVKDEDYELIAKNQSDSSLYHLAGDSIVTTVLMAIFGELYGIDWKEKIDILLNEIKNNN